jgi:hypothetical protein
MSSIEFDHNVALDTSCRTPNLLGRGMISWELTWAVAEWRGRPGGWLAGGGRRLGLDGRWPGWLGAGLRTVARVYMSIDIYI